MTELVHKEIYNSANIYFSLIKRDVTNFGLYIKWAYIFFTRFRTTKFNNPRYIITRYYLKRITKKLGFSSSCNFCFSHSGDYSAVLFSPDSNPISVDIERVGRKLPKSLRKKIKEFFPDLNLSELQIIMILESLVKFRIPTQSFSLLDLISMKDYLKIIPSGNGVFEVNLINYKVYSRIYTFDSLYVCITLESDRFNITL